jgi:hypothetical protein
MKVACSTLLFCVIPEGAGPVNSGFLFVIFFWLRSACLWARRVEASGSGIGPQGRPRSGRRVIPRCPDEKAAMKLVFATLIRAADRWCRVSISELERHQLTLLRAELGLDPPPANTNDHKTNRRNSAAA